MKKGAVLLLINILLFSTLFSGTLEITHVNYTGFETGIETTLSVSILVDDFTTQESCRLWIDPADISSWQTGYYNSGLSNYLEFNVDSSNNGTIISRSINITPNSSASQSLQELTLITTIGLNLLPSNKEQYDLKIVIDKPFDILTNNEQVQLVEKFLPILRLDDGSQIEQDYSVTNVGAEVFIPQEIEVLIDGSEIWNREGINEFVSNSYKELLTQNCESTNYIEFYVGEEPIDVVNWYGVNRDDYNTQLYASFFEEEDKVILTYWLFYLFNNNLGWTGLGIDTNFHVGEWEGMNIVFNKTDIENDYDNAIPIGAATSSHTAGHMGKRRENWNNVEKISNHPVVYVCNGSHATYFHRGKSYNQAPFPGPYEVDYHYGDGKWIIPDNPELTEARIDDFCNIYSYTRSGQIYFGYEGSNYTGIQVEILPRLTDINNFTDYWHSFGGVWGQSQYLNDNTRAESLSPSGPPFVESHWNGSNWPYTSGEENFGYKWFHPYLWYQDQQIDPNISLIVDFSVNQTSGYAPLTVSFNDQSSDVATSWLWNFGDGNTSSQQNPSHIYSSSGTFSVSVTISDGTNSITKTETNLINVQSVAEPVLSNGYVIPNPGNSDENYEFYMTYTDPLGIIPSNVELHLTTQTYNMSLVSGNVSTGAIYKYERTISNTGTFAYHFEANSGQQRFPETIGEFLNLTVNQSTAGWDAMIDAYNTNIQSSPPFEPEDIINVNVRIKNNGNYTYNSLPVEIKLISSSGFVLDTDNEIISDLIPSDTENVNLIVTIPSNAENGIYNIECTVHPSLDSDWSNNCYTLSFYIGSSVSYDYYFSDSEVIKFPGDSFYIDGLQYTIIIASAVTDNLILNTPSEGQVWMDAGELRKFDVGPSEQFVAVRRIEEWPSNGPLIRLFYGSTAPTGGPDFVTNNQYGFRGQTVFFDASAGGEYQFIDDESKYDIYKDNGEYLNNIEEWFTLDISFSNNNQEASFEFEIPNDASYGEDLFYIKTEYENGNIYFTELSLEVLHVVPHISLLSCYSFSADDTLTISGSDFGSSGQIYFNELEANNILNWSNSSILVEVPGNVSDGTLYVTNGYSTSNSISYQIISSTGDPELIQQIPDQSMMAGTTQLITDLTNNFWNPNNDDLTYNVTYSSTNISHTITDDLLYITADNGINEIDTITVEAYDPEVTVSDDFVLTIDYVIMPCVADFTANQTNVTIGSEIQFTDNSAGNPSSWQWDFDNDGTVDSYEQNPYHTYTIVGTYSVTLTVSNELYSDTEVKVDYITVCDFDINEGLVAYYPFNGNPIDESENDFDGIEHGGVQITTDRFGNTETAYYFDGIDDYISTDLEINSSFGQIISVCCWIKIEEEPLSEYRFITNGKVGDHSGSISLGCIQEPLRYYSRLVGTVTSGEFYQVTIENSNISQWYFLCMTYNGTAEKLYFNSTCIDSVEAINTIGKSSHNRLDSDYDFRKINIGRLDPFNTGYDPEYAKGYVDDIRIYNRSLSEGEINYLYHEDGWPYLNTPENLTVTVIGNEVHLSWDPVNNATSYKVFSSDDPFTGFVEDTSGSFAGESWSTSIINEKKFYYVKAVN